MKEEFERRQYLFRKCKTRQELHDWVYVFLDLDLPGCQVDEDSNSTPLDMVWESYAHFIGIGDQEASRVLYYAARDAGKTLSESVIEVLALLHLDVSVVHLASIEEQSRNSQRYLKKFFMLPDLRGFVRGDNVRETEVVSLTWLPTLLSNGMDAVKSPNPKDASSYLGYQILLSSEKDALKSSNLMVASSW